MKQNVLAHLPAAAGTSGGLNLLQPSSREGFLLRTKRKLCDW